MLINKTLHLLTYFNMNGFANHTINGVTTSYPCNDYDLMSRIPIDVLANTQGNPEGSDIWGWTDNSTGKEYAIVGTTNSTAFVDISIPETARCKSIQ